MAMIEIGAPAPDAVLRGPDEKPVSLRELAAGHPLVAIFLRHFG